MSDNLYLFANNNGSQAENNGSYRLYDMQVKENGELIRDFQPVLDSNNTPCLLDKINNKFYYNKGTGVFNTKEKPKYHKIPYLQANGTGYIDTKIKPTTGYKYSMIINSFNPIKGSAVCGAGAGTNIATTQNSGGTGYKYNYGWGVPSKNTATRTALENGLILVEVTNDNQPISIYTMYIFCWNGGTNGATGFIDSQCKIYEFKIWNNSGNLIQHLIPVLDRDGTPCFYDKVTETFFYNQGTGTFGYEIEELDANSDSYIETEYIESTGTQYIDTEVVPTANTDIDMTCRNTKKYSLLDYIEGTGTQYINTNIIPTLNTKVEFIVDITFTSEYKCIIGTNKFMKIAFQTTKNWVKVKKYGNTYSHGSNSTDYYTGKHTYIIDMKDMTNIISIDGTNFEQSQTVNLSTTSIPIYLLNSWSDDSSAVSSAISSGKIYGCKIYESDKLVFDGIPVLDSDNIPCLYDKITDTFLYSESSNVFIAGNPVNTNYILNGLGINNNKYNYKGTDTTVQPNLVASAGATLTMGSTNLALLDESDIEVATNNGWSIL